MILKNKKTSGPYHVVLLGECSFRRGARQMAQCLNLKTKLKAVGKDLNTPPDLTAYKTSFSIINSELIFPADVISGALFFTISP